jgi:4-amino-4-deoxy-L-arabinose transferase-like glycosyltransferase
LREAFPGNHTHGSKSGCGKNGCMETTRERYVGYLFLGFFSLVLLFWALGNRGLWAAEGRWAEITREMFLTGDFFHPRINDAPYFDKPLFTYWLIALTSSLTGTLNEWAVRFPSAVAGLIALGATVSLGKRLWNPRIGLTAGWLLLTSYGFLSWARTASADLENLAAIILAIAWYWRRREKPGFITFFVFYLVAFIGCQMKGLTALVVPVLAVLPDMLSGGRWRRLFSFPHVLAMLLASGVYLIPFFYALKTQGNYQESGFALVFQENIQRYFAPFDHKEPFYIYLYELPVLLLPWIPLFLGSLMGILPKWKDLSANTRWLIKAAALIFLFFTLSGSRRGYYIMPIMPLCCLLMALFVEEFGRNGLKGSSSRLFRVVIYCQGALLAAVAVTALISPLLWPSVRSLTDFAPPSAFRLAMFGTGAVALLLLALSLYRNGIFQAVTGAVPGLAGMVVVAAVLLGAFFCVQMPTLETFRTEQPFALTLKKEVGDLPPDRIAFYGKVEPNVLFYLGLSKPVTILENEEELRSFLSDHRERCVVMRRKTLKKTLSEAPQLLEKRPTFEENIFPWEKDNKKLAAFCFPPG